VGRSAASVGRAATGVPVPRLDSPTVPTFRAAYLIHGDDHGRIAERRSRLRAMAEAESGVGGVELFEGDACTPDAVAVALSSLTFAVGRRFVIADGVERWKDSEVEPVVAAMAGLDEAELTVAFFAREEGRYKVPAALLKAVEAAGGQVAEESAVKARELPRWLMAQASQLGIELDNQGARALISQVGDRQQRLVRELEKLALEYGPGAQIGVEEVQESSATSSERKLWTLADALVGGDRRTATRALLELRAQGERVPGLLYGMARRLRDALAIAEALAAGQPASQVKKTLRMPSFAADRLISDVSKRDVAAYRRALELLADLELESRGGLGGDVLSEDTAGVRTVIAIAS
jgi:DNA polymerase III subunit delta